MTTKDTGWIYPCAGWVGITGSSHGSRSSPPLRVWDIGRYILNVNHSGAVDGIIIVLRD
jgi:hypothetical protein